MTGKQCVRCRGMDIGTEIEAICQKAGSSARESPVRSWLVDAPGMYSMICPMFCACLEDGAIDLALASPPATDLDGTSKGGNGMR